MPVSKFYHATKRRDELTMSLSDCSCCLRTGCGTGYRHVIEPLCHVSFPRLARQPMACETLCRALSILDGRTVMHLALCNSASACVCVTLCHRSVHGPQWTDKISRRVRMRDMTLCLESHDLDTLEYDSVGDLLTMVTPSTHVAR